MTRTDASAAASPTTSDVGLRRFAGVAGAEVVGRLLPRLGPREALSAGRSLPRTGDALAPRFVIAGWAFRYTDLPDGRRQIIDIILPGDGIGLAPERPINHVQAVALTPLHVVNAEAVVEDKSESTVQALDRLAAQDELRLLNQLVRLGRRTAYERTVDLLLELDHRLSAVGLAHDGAMEFPPTQETLANVLGLSIVHINRTLQQLRREGRIELRRGRMTLLKLEKMPQSSEEAPANLQRSLVASPESS